MPERKTNRSMPEYTVIPVLVYENVIQASEWLCGTFGFTERLRIGKHRVQLLVGDGAIILNEGRTGQPLDLSNPAEKQPPHSNTITHSILVRVEDVNRHYERAKEHGAQILQTPTDYPYGERQYNVEDPGGHHWTFSQSIADVDPEDWGATLPENQSPGS